MYWSGSHCAQSHLRCGLVGPVSVGYGRLDAIGLIGLASAYMSEELFEHGDCVAVRLPGAPR